MLPKLSVTLLGDFGLRCGDEPVTRVKTSRMQALLAYLVLHRDVQQSRRRVSFLFWPDSTEAQARTNLRRELHHLRRALPQADRYLSIDAQSIRWRPDGPCQIDVADFEAALATADSARETGDFEGLTRALERAVDLYRGDLLPNCYDAWIDDDRARMRRGCESALERLIEQCDTGNDSSGAIRAAERLVTLDPLRESSHARLIELHASAGDRAGAIRAYARCQAVLDRELGVEPGPAARRARDAAVAASAPVPGRSTPEPLPLATPEGEGLPGWTPPSELTPLVGRERERDAMNQWVERNARSGAREPGRVLLLLGEPGIGKTRLLDELAADVRDRGGRTIRGRGFEAEMVRPYGAWIDALRSVPREWIAGSAELGSLLPELGEAAAHSDRNRLFDAVARWVGEVAAGAEGGPVALLIDDIQWLDEASAALLHYLTRLLADSPALLACAARPGEVEKNAPVDRCLRSLQREGRLRSLELTPLGRADVEALVRSVDSALDVDRVFSDSGGNPLFALEVAHALLQRPGEESQSVDDLIRNRLARLDDSAGDLLSWAAALGRGFDPSTAARVADCPLPELLAVLDRLERHGIIRPGESAGGEAAYDFAHDIVRRAAYARLSGPRRRLTHLRIATVLNEMADPDGAMASEVAHHAALGGDAGLAASASVTAAERCLRIFAYTEAAELARRGIEHTRGLPDADRIHLHMSLLRVAVAAGVPPDRAGDLDEELRGLIGEARPRGLVDEEAIGYSLLSVLNYDRENFARVHETSLRAAEALHAPDATRTTDPGMAARALSQTGACLASIERDMPRAEALLMEAGVLAERVGLELIDVPMGLGIIRHFRADRDEATRLLKEGLRMARLERDHYRASEGLTSLVMLELDSGAPDRALDRCVELAEVAAKLKGGSEAPFCAALDALARYVMARDGAAEDLEAAVDGLRRLSASRKLAYVQVHAGEADLAAGRVGAARARADEALAAARVVEYRSGLVLAGALRVRCAHAIGDPDGVAEASTVLRCELDARGDLSARARHAVAAVAAEDHRVAIN